MASAVDEIRKVLEEFVEAFNKSPRDGDALARLYTEDCKILPPGGAIGVGHTGVKRDLVETTLGGVDKAELIDVDYHQLSDDVIISVGQWTMITEGTNERRNGKDIMVWKCVNGKWRAFRDIYNWSS